MRGKEQAEKILSSSWFYFPSPPPLKIVTNDFGLESQIGRFAGPKLNLPSIVAISFLGPPQTATANFWP